MERPRELDLAGLGRTLVVCHWDADGVASASIALEEVEGEVYVPPLGLYFIPEWEAPPSGFDSLLILDYSAPRDSVERLARLAGARRVVVVDHHAVSYTHLTLPTTERA